MVVLFFQNWHLPPKKAASFVAIFLGFSASMLSVSGFESSANFVKNRKRVFLENPQKHGAL